MNKQCKGCGAIWSSSITMCSCGHKEFHPTNKHTATKKAGNVKCEFCPKTFANMNTMEYHVWRTHQPEPVLEI